MCQNVSNVQACVKNVSKMCVWERLGAFGSVWERLGRLGAVLVSILIRIDGPGSCWGAAGSCCELLGAAVSCWELLGAAVSCWELL